MLCSFSFLAILLSLHVCHPSAFSLRYRLGQVVANGTFVNATIVASGVGDVHVIGVENAVSVNLAGTASVTIEGDAGDDHSKICLEAYVRN